MWKKYFTLSFDDGLEQDKKVLALMKKYGLKGTFNLNSGMFGLQGFPMFHIIAFPRMKFAKCTQVWKLQPMVFCMKLWERSVNPKCVAL